MLATVATVVPSFMVLAWMTELPTLTGMSRIRPVMVERISVELEVAFLDDTPSRITSSDSCDAAYSSLAWFRACSVFSYSSALIRFFWNRAFSRSKLVCACLRLISDRRTRLWAAESEFMSGMTVSLAMTSPFCTIWPASLKISVMIPLIWGLMLTSLRGTILPVSTVLRVMSF